MEVLGCIVGRKGSTGMVMLMVRIEKPSYSIPQNRDRVTVCWFLKGNVSTTTGVVLIVMVVLG